MRVYMQIPYQGTEYEGYEERTRQSIDEPANTFLSEVDALRAQAEKESQFTTPPSACLQTGETG